MEYSEYLYSDLQISKNVCIFAVEKINNIPETTNMNEVYFAKQDAFTAELIAAFDSGQLPPFVKPYMDWKRGLTDLPSRQAAYEILDAIEAIDEPSVLLLAISDELSTIINILK